MKVVQNENNAATGETCTERFGGHLNAKVGIKDLIYNVRNSNSVCHCFPHIATSQDSEEKHSNQTLLRLRTGRVSTRPTRKSTWVHVMIQRADWLKSPLAFMAKVKVDHSVVTDLTPL